MKLDHGHLCIYVYMYLSIDVDIDVDIDVNMDVDMDLAQAPRDFHGPPVCLTFLNGLWTMGVCLKGGL